MIFLIDSFHWILLSLKLNQRSYFLYGVFFDNVLFKIFINRSSADSGKDWVSREEPFGFERVSGVLHTLNDIRLRGREGTDDFVL